MNIFHRASIRLTSIYLIIIMAISLIFSFGIYRLASHEIERSLRRPAGINQLIRLNEILGWEEFIASQEESITDARRHLKLNLLAINGLIFISGGVLSYLLARRSLRPIEEAHEAQSRFTSDASHELRTPIAAMRLENELALTDPDLNIKAAKDQLESNIEELDKLTALTEGLLLLSRLDESELQRELVDLRTVIQDAVDRNYKEFEENNQTIAWDKKKIEIYTNKEALAVAIATLLNNASKYSPKGEKIIIKTVKEKQTLKIMIIDKGVGIQAEEIEKIFDRFYRADQSRTKNTIYGYGVGLSIAKKSVEKLGGSIKVKSKLNNGSTFTIFLPQ